MFLHFCQFCLRLWADNTELNTASGQCPNCGKLQDIRSLGRISEEAARNLGLILRDPVGQAIAVVIPLACPTN